MVRLSATRLGRCGDDDAIAARKCPISALIAPVLVGKRVAVRDVSNRAGASSEAQRDLSQKAAIRRNLLAIFVSFAVLGGVIYAGLAIHAPSLIILVVFILLTGVCIGLLGNIFYIVVFDQMPVQSTADGTADLLITSKLDRFVLSMWFPFACLGVGLLSFVPMIGILRLFSRTFGF